MDIGLRHLRSFLVLAEERHFTVAARRLRVPQPTLSRTIQRLEAALGYRLLDRSTRHTQLTPEGDRLRDELVVLLPRLEAALRPTQPSEPFRLGFAWGFPAGWARQAVERFEEHQHTVVRVVRRDERWAGLRLGECDAALVWGAVGEPALTARRLAVYRRVAVVSSRSTLSGRESVTWRELGGRCLVVNTVSGTLTPDDWPSGTRPAVGATSGNLDEYLQAVAARQGVGVLPECVAHQYLDPGLVRLPITGAPPIGLYYVCPTHSRHPLTPALGDALAAAVPARSMRFTHRRCADNISPNDSVSLF